MAHVTLLLRAAPVSVFPAPWKRLTSPSAMDRSPNCCGGDSRLIFCTYLNCASSVSEVRSLMSSYWSQVVLHMSPRHASILESPIIASSPQHEAREGMSALVAVA